MTNKQKILFADNVAIVQSEDFDSSFFHTISTHDFYKFTGDLTATIKINPREDEATNLKDRINRLFGVWVESADEDRFLEEIYRSRLIPSSLPAEEE